MRYISVPSLDINSHLLRNKTLKCSSYKSRWIRDEWLIVSQDTKGWCMLSDKEYAVYQELAAQPFFVMPDIAAAEKEDKAEFIASLIECGLAGPNIDGFRSNLETHKISRPFHLTLILSTHCNLACRYCYLDLSPSVKCSCLNVDTAREAIRNVFDVPHRNIMIDFGEIALAFPLFRELVLFTETLQRERPDKSVTLAIQTNGTNLKKSVIDYLECHKVFLGISIDGPRKLHDQIRVSRSGQGSHSHAESGLQEIIRREMPHIVLCTVSSANVGYPEELADYFVQLGVSHFAFKPVIKRGVALNNWQSVGVTAFEYNEFLGGIVGYAIKHRTWRALDVYLIKFLFRLMRDPRGWNDQCLGVRCGAGDDMLVINPYGDFYPCPRLTSLKRNSVFLGSNFADAIQEGYHLGPTASLEQCAECIWSTYCEGPCRLSCHDNERSIDADNFHCSVNRHIYELFVEKLIPATDLINGSGEIGPGHINLIQKSFFESSLGKTT